MIEFENVSFSYTGQEHGGLHDINLKISDGECVLFCGRSGCGKTTITRLVNGLIPQVLSRGTSWPCAGRWSGNQQYPHVSDCR